MAGQRTSFAKLERDRNKKAKAAAKRERRQDAAGGALEAGDPSGASAVEIDDHGGVLSADELLALIESIHKRHDAGTISYEEFEEKKTELLARLPID